MGGFIMGAHKHPTATTDTHMLELVTNEKNNRGQVQIVVLVLLIALAVALVGFLGPTLIGFVGEVSENPDANVDIDPNFEDGSVDIVVRSVNDDTEAIQIEHIPLDDTNEADDLRFSDAEANNGGQAAETGAAELGYGDNILEEGDLIIVVAEGGNDETTIREYEVPENVEEP